MSVISPGKYTHNVAPTTLEKFSEVQQDVLWYLMNLTNIHRLHTKEAFREFLIRYLLIVDKPLESKASDFIDNGVLIDGVFENTYFSFSVKNLIELIGFEASNSLYNINGSLPEFIQSFTYQTPTMVLEADGNSNDGKPKFKISKDLMLYALMGIKTICMIDYLHISFREKVSDLSQEYVDSVLKFVDYVLDTIPNDTFDKVVAAHPDLTHFRQRFQKSDEVVFDVYSLPQEDLKAILNVIADERDLDWIQEEEVISEDVMKENGATYYMTHITFAAGVKWGYIELSEHPYSLHFGLDPLFDVEYEELLGPDFEVYPTQDIYDGWKMKEWAHLLPEKL
jgi:hypothetical protein